MRIAIYAACGAFLLPLLFSVACETEQPVAAPNTLTADERDAGWELLFDGKTMAGWDDPAQKTPPSHSWTVEDGCLKAVAKPHIREDLLTKDVFRDFELLFDWRLSPGGNSGVKYRIQDRVLLDRAKIKPGAKSFEETVGYELEHRLADRSKISPDGEAEEYIISFEYQVIDDKGHPDAGRGPKYSAGSLYGLVGPSFAAARPVGEFNHSRLVVTGNHVEHWLNGFKVVDTSLDSAQVTEGLAKRWKAAPAVYELLTKRPQKTGPIDLQHHGDEVWFRNIKVHRLSD